MPEIGPFHVHLNSCEDVVMKYHFIFEYLCKNVFGNHYILAKKPKPWRISLCIVIALTGWLHIRKSIIAAFGPCKDPEYLVIFHLLDEVVPLVFYQYPVIFRGGNLQLNIWLMFISMTKRHYNKASLSWLSDLHYQAQYLPELYNFWANNLSLVTQKKVEIYHFVLQRHISGMAGKMAPGKNGTRKNGTGITTYAEKMAPLENCKIKKRKKQQFFFTNLNILI